MLSFLTPAFKGIFGWTSESFRKTFFFCGKIPWKKIPKKRRNLALKKTHSLRIQTLLNQLFAGSLSLVVGDIMAIYNHPIGLPYKMFHGSTHLIHSCHRMKDWEISFDPEFDDGETPSAASPIRCLFRVHHVFHVGRFFAPSKYMEKNHP